MNARNAFQQQKGPERNQQYTFNLSGTLLKERTSFSLSAGGASLYDSANIFAATTDGTRTAPVRRPSDRINFTGRLDHALNEVAHAARDVPAERQRSAQPRRRQLRSRPSAPSRGRRATACCASSESGPLATAWFGESRLQVRRTDTDVAAVARGADGSRARRLHVGRRAAGRRPAHAPRSSGPPTSTGRAAGTRCGSARCVEGGVFRSDNRTNYLGTYTFASLADYEAGIAVDLHAARRQSAGRVLALAGRALRPGRLARAQEPDAERRPAPGVPDPPRRRAGTSRRAAGLTWSPFKSGKTTVRAGGGIFYDWLEADVYEQTLRVDGVRQQDLVVRNPGLSRSVRAAGSSERPADQQVPAGRRAGHADAQHGEPRHLAAAVADRRAQREPDAHDRQQPAARAQHQRAARTACGPIAAFGNVTQVESTARVRGTQLHTGLNINVPARRMMIFANYSFVDQQNDADGPFSLPADSYDLAAEWGPAAGMPRHTASAVVNLPLPYRLPARPDHRRRDPARATTSPPAATTTATRCSTIGPPASAATAPSARASWDVAARLSYAFGFGERSRRRPGRRRPDGDHPARRRRGGAPATCSAA